MKLKLTYIFQFIKKTASKSNPDEKRRRPLRQIVTECECHLMSFTPDSLILIQGLSNDSLSLGGSNKRAGVNSKPDIHVIIHVLDHVPLV